MQIVVQDLLTQYTRVGQGKAVLILHGWADTSKSWQTFAKRLAEQYDVIVPDLPGFGGTQMPDSTWGLTEYAEFVQAFLQKTQLKPYAVIGHSNGGAVSLRGIGQGIFQAEKLVLLASAGVRGTKSRRGLYIVTKVGKAVASPLPKRLKKKLRNKLYEKVGSDLLVAEHLQESFKKIIRDDVRDDAAYIGIPTLLVYGDADTETPLSLGRQLQDAIEGSRLEALPGIGHFVQVDAAARTNELVEEFLSE